MNQKAYTTTDGVTTNLNLVGSSTYTSPEFVLDGLRGYSFSTVWDNKVGFEADIELQVSACSNGNFTTLRDSEIAITQTSDRVEMYNVTDVYYKYVRLKVTVIAGSATLLVEITRKS